MTLVAPRRLTLNKRRRCKKKKKKNTTYRGASSIDRPPQREICGSSFLGAPSIFKRRSPLELFPPPSFVALPRERGNKGHTLVGAPGPSFESGHDSDFDLILCDLPGTCRYILSIYNMHRLRGIYFASVHCLPPTPPPPAERQPSPKRMAPGTRSSRLLLLLLASPFCGGEAFALSRTLHLGHLGRERAGLVGGGGGSSGRADARRGGRPAGWTRSVVGMNAADTAADLVGGWYHDERHGLVGLFAPRRQGCTARRGRSRCCCIHNAVRFFMPTMGVFAFGGR